MAAAIAGSALSWVLHCRSKFPGAASGAGGAALQGWSWTASQSCWLVQCPAM